MLVISGGIEIIAFEEPSKGTLKLEIPYIKAKELSVIFNEDYKLLGDCISIIEKKLYILSPESKGRNVSTNLGV